VRPNDDVSVAETKALVVQRRFRGRVPEAHRVSLDTRIVWLWNQRFGTVQTVWKDSPDVLDHTAATLILQAIMGKDLDSIAQIFQRLEGGPVVDEDLLDGSSSIRV
jgi:hypothetical protein